MWDAASGSDNDTGDAVDISELDAGEADAAADADTEPADVSDGEDAAAQGGPFDDCLLGASGFAINPAGIKPQFQPRVAFDGAAIWVVHTQQRSPSSDTVYDIIVTRVTCEQGAIQPVFTQILNTESIKSDSPSPSIDIAGNSVHVVWSDSADSSMNQGRVAYRRLALDGSSPMNAETFVEFRFAGGAQTDYSYPEILALPGEEAIIAAAAGYKSIILQKVDEDGGVVEDAVAVSNTVESLRTRPSITGGATGPVWVAWMELESLGSPQYRVGYASFERRDFEPMSQPVTLDTLSIRGKSARFAKGLLDDENVFFVEQSNTHRTRLYNATRQGASTEFGVVDMSSSNPSVTSFGDRGAVAWFSRDESVSVERHIKIRSFHDTGSRINLGAAMTVAKVNWATVPQLPGRPEIVWVGGDTYFVAVQDGITAASTKLNGYDDLRAQVDWRLHCNER